ncbi:MAG: DNA-protecting protein DprA [Synechococcales cyanobacterium M58_A2018_015]|nr:DNA-protecting protein DprA [Synechococcales cyanobacterium M58_A2018_015]
MAEERAFWLAWSQVSGIGAVLIRRLHQHFGSLALAWEASPADLEAVEGFGPQVAALAVQGRRSIDPELLLDQHQQDNPEFWTPADAAYPRLLWEIPDPPPVLYYRGQMDQLDHLDHHCMPPAVAIVGTRGPTDYGKRWTRRLSMALAQAGFTIVSGLAEGIDTEAHQSCLSVGGRTLAVMGTGVDVIYPPFNRRLAEQIAHNGLLLSEYPAGTQPDRVNFPRRNRIIAGLCQATLVIEAPQKSGALITARLANDYGREVYALPGSLDNPRARGCLELLSQGAQLILGEAALLQMLDTLPPLSAAPVPAAQLSLFAAAPPLPPEPTPPLDPELEQVLQAVASEPIAVDRIVQQAELATGTVLSALAQLELMGLVSQLPGMRYQRA